VTFCRNIWQYADTSRSDLQKISDEAWNKILADEFDRVFDLELNQEYSPALYRVPLLMACAVSVGAAVFLVTAGVHAPILNHVATPVYFAVLGAFIWSLWTLITRYTQNDLMPSTFWRILLGYLLAIAYGLLAKRSSMRHSRTLGRSFLPRYHIAKAWLL
jgi:hypothetical protein